MNFKTPDGQLIPDAYERAFVRTVLHLQGVFGTPSECELDAAKLTFKDYGRRTVEARMRDTVIDPIWLRGRMPEQAAVERAFLFVRFESVSNTTDIQRRALYNWLTSGAVH
jgi:hypothetical protein